MQFGNSARTFCTTKSQMIKLVDQLLYEREVEIRKEADNSLTKFVDQRASSPTVSDVALSP